MTTAIRRRRGTTAQHSTFIGLDGEVTVDTTKETVVVHDGATQGGFPLLRENGSQNLVTTGTATAASFIPTSSTAPTNGVYLPAANSVAISTGGSGRLFVNSSGNVGVGTANPVGRLTIKGAASASAAQQLAFEYHGSTNKFLALGIQDASGDAQVMSGSGAALIFYTNSDLVSTNERLRITSTGTVNIVGAGTAGATQAVSFNGSAPVNSLVVDSSGRLGVGTSSPGSILHCNYSTATDTYIRTSNSAASSGFDVGVSSGGIAYLFNRNNTDIRLGTNSQERVTITSAGLVGIGTSDPTSGTSSFYDDLVVRNATSGTGAGITIQSNSTNGFSGLNLRKADGTDVAKFVSESSSGKLYIETAGSAAITVDSSQRVGIGTTSPVSPLDVVGIDGLTLGTDRSNNTTKLGVISTAHYANATNSFGMVVGLSDSTDNILNLGGGVSGRTAATIIRFFTAANNSTAAGTERARIDSSGRLLVGTSSTQQVGSVTANLQVAGTTAGTSSISAIRHSADANPPYLTLGKSRGSLNGVTAVVNNDLLGYIEFAGANGTDISSIAARISAEVDGEVGTSGDTTDMPGRLVFSTTKDGQASPTEAMRIDSVQNVFFGQQSDVAGGLDGIGISGTNRTITAYTTAGTGAGTLLHARRDTDGNAVQFLYNSWSTQVGTISVTASATAYNTSSDYRLKENVIPVTDGITRLQQLKPSRFNFIADPSKTVDGFLAHEAAEVVPECVTGEKDEVDDEGNPIYQGIDQSKLVPLLTAALQEAIGEIELLKARVAVLEAN